MHVQVLLWGMRIHWVKCCDCTEVKVYEDLPVQESTCTSTAVGNEYTGLNVLTVMRFNCLKAWKFRT